MRNYQNLIAIEEFRDPSKFIYNSNLVVFTEFGAQLKKLVDDSVCLGATFRNFTDGNYGNGAVNLNSSIYGTVLVQNEKLALLGGYFNKSLDFFFTNNLADNIPSGELEFQFYPNYSNLPDSSQNIFHLGELGKANSLEIIHTTTGDILFNIFDNAKNLHQVVVNNVVFETALTQTEFKIVWDFIDNTENDLQQDEARFKIWLYFQGNLVGSYDFDAETFNPQRIQQLGFGQSIPVAMYPNFYISDLLINSTEGEFDPVEEYTTQSYLPMVETVYTQVPQKIEPNTALTLEKLNDITALTNEDFENKTFYVAYTFEIGNKEYFFDRQDLTWKEHNNPEDISDLAYMLLYKDRIINKGTSFKVIPYLRSVSGKATPQITTLTIKYDEFIPFIECAPKALVYGYVRDVAGNPVRNAKILITPSKSSVSQVGNFIIPATTKVVRTGEQGYWDVALNLSSNFDSELLYNFQIIVRDEVVFERANIEITQEGTIKFEDLIKENDLGN